MTFIIGTPHAHNSGYFRNDDRNSGGQLSESDVQTCTHCQCVIKLSEWKLEGAYCGKCEAPICAACGEEAARIGCVPFAKRIELYFESDYKYSQFVKLAGLEPPKTPTIIIP